MICNVWEIVARFRGGLSVSEAFCEACFFYFSIYFRRRSTCSYTFDKNQFANAKDVLDRC